MCSPRAGAANEHHRSKARSGRDDSGADTAKMSALQGKPSTVGMHFVILSVACTKCKMLLHMGIMPVAKLQQMEDGPPRIQIPS